MTAATVGEARDQCEAVVFARVARRDEAADHDAASLLHIKPNKPLDAMRRADLGGWIGARRASMPIHELEGVIPDNDRISDVSVMNEDLGAVRWPRATGPEADSMRVQRLGRPSE